MKEIKSHTALRGLASIGVVLFHYTIGMDYHHYLEKSHAFVDMFFILSGFIIAAVYSKHLIPGNKDGYKSFYISRFARIYPLYIASIIITLLFILTVGKTINPENAGHIFFSFLAVQAWGVSDQFYYNFPAWSISAEFAAYLFFPLLAFYWRSKSNIPLLLLIISLAYFLLVHSYGTLDVDERMAGFRGIIGFSLGMVLYHYREIIYGLTSINLWQALSIAALTISFYLNVSELFLIPSFSALIILTWTDEGFLSRILSVKYLQLLGVWSFGIYLLHIPVRMVFSYLWPHIPYIDTNNEEAFVLSAILLTILSAFISYEYFENPLRNWIKNFHRKKVSTSSV